MSAIPVDFRTTPSGLTSRGCGREDPVHYCRDGVFGSYWSITKYRDIMAVDTNHRAFSSEAGGITIVDRTAAERFPMFIAMDPPKHDEQRKTVSPIVAPGNLANLEGLIRGRARTILDSLPRNETFNWVEKVSIELTTQMLATLFDFPFEDRRLLTYWSDVATTVPQAGQPIDTWEKRAAILAECLAYFTKLWNERINKDPARISFQCWRTRRRHETWTRANFSAISSC